MCLSQQTHALESEWSPGQRLAVQSWPQREALSCKNQASRLTQLLGMLWSWHGTVSLGLCWDSVHRFVTQQQWSPDTAVRCWQEWCHHAQPTWEQMCIQMAVASIFFCAGTLLPSIVCSMDLWCPCTEPSRPKLESGQVWLEAYILLHARSLLCFIQLLQT